jgi:hypothetical protein
MDVIEYLLFIPLLIYGIALTQLLGQWRRMFDRNNFYAPFVVTIVAFTETAVQNVYHYLPIFTARSDHSYGSYLLDLAGPFLFLLASASLSHGEHEEAFDRERFSARIPSAYAFMSAFVALHLLPQFRADTGNFLLRVPLIALLIAVAITRKAWLIYVVGLAWLVGLSLRLAGRF